MTQKKKPAIAIGSRVYTPTSGAGILERIVETEVAGITLQVYQVRILENGALHMIPLANLERSGLRTASSEQVMNLALSTLAGPLSKSRNLVWNRRATEYGERINSGDPVLIAQALRDIDGTAREGEMSYTARELFELGSRRLASELADVFGWSPDEIARRIEEALAEGRRRQGGRGAEAEG